MTGAVIPEDAESSEPEDAESSGPTGAESIDVDEFGRQTTGSEGPHQDKRCSETGSRKARGHSGSKKVDCPINVGGSTFEATRVCGRACV